VLAKMSCFFSWFFFWRSDKQFHFVLAMWNFGMSYSILVWSVGLNAGAQSKSVICSTSLCKSLYDLMSKKKCQSQSFSLMNPSRRDVLVAGVGRAGVSVAELCKWAFPPALWEMPWWVSYWYFSFMNS
jgi:hypothetical protein